MPSTRPLTTVPVLAGSATHEPPLRLAMPGLQPDCGGAGAPFELRVCVFRIGDEAAQRKRGG
jgi:hypothetical protein